MLSRLPDWVYEYAIALSAILVALIMGIIYFWQPTWGPGDDLRANLFSEALGIAFTIGLIDILLKANERRRTRRARFAAYDEAQVIFNRLRGLWVSMVIVSKATPTEDGADLFTSSVVDIVRNRFDSDASAPVTPARTWTNHLYENQREVRDKIDKIIQRYIMIADIELITTLRALENCAFLEMAKVLIGIKQHIANSGSRYVGFPLQDDMDKMLPLRDLYQVLNRLAKEFGISKISDMTDNPMQFSKSETKVTS